MEFTEIHGIQNKVSRIGLGTWSMGGSLWGGFDEQESIKTVHRALDQGINFIDTAPAYGEKYASEKMLGKALKAYRQRDQVILATKFGLVANNGGIVRNTGKSSILKEIDASLKSLQVDYIDLYQVHWPDPLTPISETAETLKYLKDQGKIRAIGVCNYSVEQIQEFRKSAPLETCQLPYNLFERELEESVIAYCLKENIALLGYSSIARGLLSGKMKKERKFQGDDFRKSMDPKFTEPRFSQYLNGAALLDEWVTKTYNRPLIALAVRWSLDQGIHVALWGARKRDQLDQLEAVFGWTLKQEDFQAIEKIIQETVKDPIGPDFMAPPIRTS